jgi:hypothetical protein
MDVVERARTLLEPTPRKFYCEGCLARALGVSRGAARDAAIVLAERSDIRRTIDRCDVCERVTLALGFTPPVKCARCSWTISERDQFVAEQDDLLHHHCWRILQSSARIADSRHIAGFTRDLIQRSRARLGDAG